MKKIALILTLVMAICVLGSAFADIEAGPGDEVKVDLNVQSDSAVYGLFDVDYNNKVLQYMSASAAEGVVAGASDGKINVLKKDLTKLSGTVATVVFKVLDIEDDTKETVKFTKKEAYDKSEKDAEITATPVTITLTADQIKAFVKRCYTLLLNRTASGSESDGWVGLLKNKEAAASNIISGFTRSAEYTNRQLTNKEIVGTLYTSMLNREPQGGEDDGWAQFLDNGCSDAFLINGFCGSPEFKAICDKAGIEPGNVPYETRDLNPSVTAFVNRCYKESFGRNGEAGGLNGWAGLLLDKTFTPKQVAHSFVFSQEMENRQLSNKDWVITMYRLYMGREPAEGEYQGWVGLLESGTSKEDVNNGFADSQEFANIVASYGL